MGPPITLSGFNNIDFKVITDIIINAERQPITRIQSNVRTEQSRLSAYGSLISNLSSLKSVFDGLKDSEVYTNLKATVGDSSVLGATATSSSTKGTFTIEVTSLSRPQVTASATGQFNNVDATIIDSGTFSITQSGTTTNIDLSGVKSLAQLRDAINNQQTGVEASIINDGSATNPFRLVLTSSNPGTTNAFTVSDQTKLGAGTPGTVLNLSTDATNGVAKDTVLKYNGITITSSSTNVSEAIPGLSLNILKTGTTTVTVDDDNSTLKAKVQEAVDAFNSFNSFYTQQIQSKGSLPLYGDSLLRGVNRQLRNFLASTSSNSGVFKSAAAIGIKLSLTGKLEIDNAALDSALSSKRADVATLLSGDSGLAAQVSNLIDGYTKSGGTLANAQARSQTTIDSYNKRIEVLEAQLALRRQTLTQQFTAADQAISQLNSQVNALAGLNNQFRLF